MFGIFGKHQKNSMYRKLFAYMIIFAGLLLSFIILAMILFGQFNNVKKNYINNLNMQLSIEEKQISGYFEKSAVSAMHLSLELSDYMEDILRKENISFDDLKNNQKALNELQDGVFENLKSSMFYADVSGSFLIWDTSVNSKVKNAKNNKSGLYLKLDTRSLKESSVLVYRGNPEIGKKHGAMPHRKWKLEYDISKIPNYKKSKKKENSSLYDSYKISPVFTLPGTSEKVMLISLPIIGKDGEVYGVCGFEVEQMFFKDKLSQPTRLDRLTSVFVPRKSKKINTSQSLSSGSEDGYYYLPKENLISKNHGMGLKEYIGKNNKYIGVEKELSLIKNGEKSLLITMIPMSDYKRDVLKNIVNIIVSVILFLFFAIVVSLNFSRRYISPITDSIAIINNQEKIFDEDYKKEIEKRGFREINDLIDLVRKQIQNKSVEGLPIYIEEKFKNFIDATASLTPAEMNVLYLLIQGYSVDELPSILFVSKSTAKHHILKIYKKLKVSSRGELLLYLDLIKGCGMIDKIVKKNEN